MLCCGLLRTTDCREAALPVVGQSNQSKLLQIALTAWTSPHVKWEQFWIYIHTDMLLMPTTTQTDFRAHQQWPCKSIYQTSAHDGTNIHRCCCTAQTYWKCLTQLRQVWCTWHLFLATQYRHGNKDNKHNGVLFLVQVQNMQCWQLAYSQFNVKCS